MSIFGVFQVRNFPHSAFFRSVFSRIRTEHGEIPLISPYSIRMRENTDQKNSEYGHFLRSASGLKWVDIEKTLRGKLRSRHLEVFCKNGVLGNFAKFTEKHLRQSLFFSKVAGLTLQLF